MKFLIIPLIVFTVLSACNGFHPDNGDIKESALSTPDSSFFRSLVTQYTQSIDRADTAMGAELWSHTDPVSFIHPRGHAHGWGEIKNIYVVFRDNFTERHLRFYNLKSSIYPDFAWLEFYWTFDAVLNTDRSPVHTEGRESQIWRKTAGGWRLIHVHYSAMPGRNRGFATNK